jgi:murein DD-endopeptidase MepM/ murein hydrolase activator NlpD
MKQHLAIIFLIITNVSFAQSESAAYKTVADRFQLSYNASQYDSIYTSFSSDMQAALPFDKTKEFLSNLKTQAGSIKQRQFMKYEETYASYKTIFERALFAVNISVDNNSKINGFYVAPFKENNLPKIDRNKTKLSLPFKEEWTVIWGGDTKAMNHHVENEAQKNAFDIIITNEKGTSYKTDGKANEDYYAFGKEIIAPCDGEVVVVVDGINDNEPGKTNPMYVPGNTVIIKTANQEYLFFAHFKQHSIVVRQGQKVQQDQLLGLCGNSGNSSEPHLHFHIQNVADINNATGVKCYFENIRVNGAKKSDYSPIKGDKITHD